MKLSVESAMMPLPLAEVDMTIVKKFQQHMHLMELLDHWILSPDHDLLPSLHRLAELTKKIYQFPPRLTLFRGFDLATYQDSMGLTGMPHVGQAVRFETDCKPLSFSTDIEIARAFGGIILSAQFDTRKTAFLHITNELAYIVSQLRNLEPQTQKEVIILPPSAFTATVVQAKKNPFGWMGW